MPLLWGVHLTEGQLDPNANQMSCWPDIILFLVTECLYWGVCLTEGQPDPKGHQMSRWPDVVPLLVTRCLCWGVHLSSDQPDLTQFWAGYVWLVLLLATRCLYGGSVCLSAKRTSENLNTLLVWVLLHRGLFYERPMTSQNNKLPCRGRWDGP